MAAGEVDHDRANLTGSTAVNVGKHDVVGIVYTTSKRATQLTASRQLAGWA
jgi:hypothetical protein